MSVAFFLPAFVSPFLPKALSKFVLAIDIIFSYLYVHPSTHPHLYQKTATNTPSHPDGWLHSSSPPKTTTGTHASSTLLLALAAPRKRPTRHSCSWPCKLPRIILLFHNHLTQSTSIFTFFAIFLEVASLWAYRRENVTPDPHREKNGASHPAPAGRAPLDAPADRPADTV